MDTWEKEIPLLPLLGIASWIVQPVDAQYIIIIIIILIIIIIIIIAASEFSLGGSSP
jgi:hypothetical protein